GLIHPAAGPRSTRTSKRLVANQPIVVVVRFEMQVRTGTASARAGQAQLRPGANELPQADAEAVGLEMPIDAASTVAVIDDDAVAHYRRTIADRLERAHVGLAVMREDHDSVECRKDGNAHLHRGESANLGVLSRVAVVGPVRAVERQHVGTWIEV